MEKKQVKLKVPADSLKQGNSLTIVIDVHIQTSAPLKKKIVKKVVDKKKVVKETVASKKK